MLEKNDLDQIRGVVREEVSTAINTAVNASESRIITAVGEMLEQNIMPQFDRIYEKFDGVDKRFDGVEKRLEHVEKSLVNIKSVMVTRDYLEDRLADFKTHLTNSAGKVNRKLVAFMKLTYRKGGMTAEEFTAINSGASF